MNPADAFLYFWRLQKIGGNREKLSIKNDTFERGGESAGERRIWRERLKETYVISNSE